LGLLIWAGSCALLALLGVFLAQREGLETRIVGVGLVVVCGAWFVLGVVDPGWRLTDTLMDFYAYQSAMPKPRGPRHRSGGGGPWFLLGMLVLAGVLYAWYKGSTPRVL
jgi:hypothetical protein